MQNDDPKPHSQTLPYALVIMLALMCITTHGVAQCEIQQLSQPGIGGGSFGLSVIDDGTILVGNPEEGTATVYRRSGSEWLAIQQLLPQMVNPQSEFGWGIDISGNLLAIGDDQPIFDGSVSSYRYDEGAWQSEQIIEPEDAEASKPEIFGRRLSLNEDRLIIGNSNSAFADPAVPGTAFIFQFVDTTWQLEAELNGPDALASNSFGKAVEIVGDTAAVADTNIDEPNTNPNVVFIYSRDNEQWSLTQQISPPDTPSAIGFGLALALDGDADTLVIGAYQDLGQLGSIYVYQRNGEQWVFEQKLTASEAFGPWAFLGVSVAINDAGDTIVGGAFDDFEAGFEAGAAHVFRKDGNHWYEAAKLLPPEGNEDFGVTVSISGDVGVIGSTNESADGSAHIYAGLRGIDCNDNGVADACDIHNGTSFDSNNNGVPNECDGVPDFDGDEVIDLDDLIFLLKVWGTADADTNQDGVTSVTDLLALFNAWGSVNDPPDCSSNASCCAPHAPGGCADSACCHAVCEEDPYCCESAWDMICVNSAQELCDCAPPQSCGGGGDCCALGGNGSPGCDNSACCEFVCELGDPMCCEVQWDAWCANLARVLCEDCPPAVCNPDTFGSCCFTHGSPGCNDPTCCEMICEVDPFCCESFWDSQCAEQAEAMCDVCK